MAAFVKNRICVGYGKFIIFAHERFLFMDFVAIFAHTIFYTKQFELEYQISFGGFICQKFTKSLYSIKGY